MIGVEQTLLREGLAILLNSQPAFEVTEEPSSSEKFDEALGHIAPDVLLLDLMLPESKSRSLKQLKKIAPSTKIIILSSLDRSESVHQTLNEGAIGFISKQAPSSEVIEAIKHVIEGNYYLSPSILNSVIQTYLEGTRTKPRGKNQDNSKYVSYNKLSDREKQIFKLLLEGLSSRQISEGLDISPKTVDKHRASIFSKTGVENSTQLLHYAIDLKLLPTAHNPGPAYH